MTAQHTPTPWEIIERNEYLIIIDGVQSKRNQKIRLAVCDLPACHIAAEANAAFIVKAVNCHDELVLALDIAQEFLTGRAKEIALEALARARG